MYCFSFLLIIVYVVETLGCSSFSGIPHFGLSRQPYKFLRQGLPYPASAAVWQGEALNIYISIFNAYTHYGALETRGQQVLNAQPFRSTSLIYSSCSFRTRSVCFLVRNGNRCTEQWFGWVPDAPRPPMLLGSCPVFTSVS